MSKSNQNIETPLMFVRAVEKFLGIEGGFEYDMAGTEENKKGKYVCTEEQDSLSLYRWPTDGWCWLNPPFAKVGEFAIKCLEQSKCSKINYSKIVSIWPLSGDLNMIDTWKNASVYIIHGRIWPEVRGCMLCEWNCDADKRISGLRWDKKNGILITEW